MSIVGYMKGINYFYLTIKTKRKHEKFTIYNRINHRRIDPSVRDLFHISKPLYLLNETEMTIETQIKRHERCLEILQAIQSLKVRRQCNRDSLNGFQGTFPSLRRRLENNIDTLDKCIIKLNNKYQNIN